MANKKATTTAIAVAHVVTLDSELNTFVATLTAEQQSLVRKETASILAALDSVVKARVSIGESLVRLSDALKTESFNKFCDTVGKRMGFSKATAYRWIGGFKMVHGSFGAAAPIILRLTDGGNKITITDQKTSRVVFTPEAKMALEKLKADAPLPTNPTPEQSEQWGRTFCALVDKNGRSPGKQSSALDIIKAKVDKLWSDFGDDKNKGSIVYRINHLKGAAERKTALDLLGDTLSGMVTEHSAMCKVIAGVPAVPQPTKTPKAKRTKAEPTSNIAAA